MLTGRLVAFTLMATLAAAPLTAQDTEMVPADFVRAVLGRGTYQPVLMPGRIPDEVTAVVELPDGARVLGTVGYDSSMSVHLVVADDVDELRAFFAQQFAAAPWTTLAPRRRTGFVADTPAAPVVFCRDDRTVVTVDTQDHDGEVLLRIGYQPDVERPPCEQQVPEDRTNQFQNLRDHLPVLSMPEGDAFRGGASMGGGRDSVSTGIELRSELSAAEIAAHVALDLRAQEWQADAEAIGDVSAASTWRQDFDDGFRAFGELVVMQAAPGSYRVEFRLTGLDGQDRPAR